MNGNPTSSHGDVVPTHAHLIRIVEVITEPERYPHGAADYNNPYKVSTGSKDVVVTKVRVGVAWVRVAGVA
jgi:hypothetical protein